MSDLKKWSMWENAIDYRNSPVNNGNVPTEEDWNPDALGRMIKIPKYWLSSRSYSNLEGVDPKLIVVIGTAIQNSPYDFMVIEGLRTKERQQKLFDQGRSKTLNSRHLTGHAVDLAIWKDGKVNWKPELYVELSDHIKNVAHEHRVDIEWGGDWTGFFDGVHFQLSW